MAHKTIDYSILEAKEIPLPPPQTNGKVYTKGPAHKLKSMEVGKCLEIPLGDRSGNSVKSSIKTAAKRCSINIDCRLDEAAKMLRVWRLA
jgi:hypothetical protein